MENNIKNFGQFNEKLNTDKSKPQVEETITAEEIIKKLQKKSGLTKEELYKKLEELPEFLKKTREK